MMYYISELKRNRLILIYIDSDISKKFRTGPFEQTPQDLKRAARARAKMRKKFLFWWRARARRVLGLEGSVQKVLFEIS